MNGLRSFILTEATRMEHVVTITGHVTANHSLTLSRKGHSGLGDSVDTFGAVNRAVSSNTGTFEPDDAVTRAVDHGNQEGERISWPAGFGANSHMTMLVIMPDACRVSSEIV